MSYYPLFPFSLRFFLFALFLAVLAFAATLAWKNSDVLNAVIQRWTLTSLILVAIAFLGVGCIFWRGDNWEAVRKYELDRARLAVVIFFIGFICLSFIALAAVVSIVLLRGRIIQGLDMRLVDFMRLMILTIWQRRAAPPPKFGRAGWLLLLASGLLCMAVLRLMPNPFAYVLELFTERRKGGGHDTQLVALLWTMLFYARRCFQPSAETILKTNPRPPVLLLRSFIDDEANINRDRIAASLTSHLKTGLPSTSPKSVLSLRFVLRRSPPHHRRCPCRPERR